MFFKCGTEDVPFLPTENWLFLTVPVFVAYSVLVKLYRYAVRWNLLLSMYFVKYCIENVKRMNDYGID